MKKLAVLVFALILAIPVVSLAKTLDEEKIVTDKSLAGYKSIGVKLFATDDIEYDNVDKDEMRRMKNEDFLKEVQEKLARATVAALKDDGFDAFVVNGKNAGKADMIMEGRITKINLGSAAVRFWVGWGAGGAGMSVKGELKDAKSGDTLVKFEHENSSGLRDTHDKYEMVEHEAQDLGDKLGEFVQKITKK